MAPPGINQLATKALRKKRASGASVSSVIGGEIGTSRASPSLESELSYLNQANAINTGAQSIICRV